MIMMIRSLQTKTIATQTHVFMDNVLTVSTAFHANVFLGMKENSAISVSSFVVLCLVARSITRKDMFQPHPPLIILWRMSTKKKVVALFQKYIFSISRNLGNVIVYKRKHPVVEANENERKVNFGITPM